MLAGWALYLNSKAVSKGFDPHHAAPANSKYSQIEWPYDNRWVIFQAILSLS